MAKLREVLEGGLHPGLVLPPCSGPAGTDLALEHALREFVRIQSVSAART
jgi:hypothetical protein